MTYNPNVPDLPHLISNDIPAMLINSQQINIVFAVDHVPFNPSVTTSGWHKQVRFPATIATPVLAAGQGAVYTKTIAGRTELFYTSSSAETQITSASGSGGLPIWKGGTPGTNGVVALTAATQGSMTLPNGLIFKWDKVATSGLTSAAVTFSPAFPTAVFNIQLSIQVGDTSSKRYVIDQSTPPTNTGFTIELSTSAIDFVYWFAIGN